MTVTGRAPTKDKTVAEALRYCCLHCDTAEESNLVDWVTEHIADALYSRPARSTFDREGFLTTARAED